MNFAATLDFGTLLLCVFRELVNVLLDAMETHLSETTVFYVHCYLYITGSNLLIRICWHQLILCKLVTLEFLLNMK